MVFKCAGVARETCDYEAEARWCGQCPRCGSNREPRRYGPETDRDKRVTLAKAADMPDPDAISTKIPAVDRVVSKYGGIVTGSIGQTILLTGPKGTGKTTLLLQIANGVASQKKHTVLFASGEMSNEAILLYAQRVGVTSERVEVMGIDAHGGEVEKVCERAEELGAALVIHDSTQTGYLADVQGNAGSTAQVKESINHFTEWVQKQKCCLIAVCHQDKEGGMAGPETIGHLCETIIEFFPYDFIEDPKEIAYDRHGELREEMNRLRVFACIEKNRYNATGIEEMLIMQPEGKGFLGYSKLSLV